MNSHDSLADLNTLGIQAGAKSLRIIESSSALMAALADRRAGEAEALVLGGGSNVVLLRDHYERVLVLRQKGVQFGDKGRVIVSAGENWHDFVMLTLQRGYQGLENLALIPGACGAAPVQNIGAYGAELAQFVHRVRAVHRDTLKTADFDNAACQFGYRHSFFKSLEGRRWIICSIELQLSQSEQLNLDYPALAEAWDGRRAVLTPEQLDSEPAALQLARLVMAVRSSKLPDPATLPNAGSFFKNPIVDSKCHDRLLASWPRLVSYPQSSGQHKIAAGWLLEQAGFKGKIVNGLGMHDRQALVLINPGRRSGQDVMGFARGVQVNIAARFGLTLEIEPDLL